MQLPVRLNANRGQEFGQHVIAHAVAERGAAAAYAARRWGQNFVQRAGVGNTEADGMQVPASARAEFVGLVTEISAAARIRARTVSPFVPILRPDNFATAGFIGQSKAIPVGRIDLAKVNLESKKCGAIWVGSNESLQDPKSEGWITGDLARACAAAIDEAAFNAANAGDASTPAALTYGVPSSASTGDPAVDVANLFSDFSGADRTALIVMDRNTAVRLTLYRDTSGTVMFPDMALIGGSILGVPVVISQFMPHDSSGGSIAVIDGNGVAMNIETIEITRSDATMLEQDSAPTGASDTPVAASATLVSMFQTECTALKAIVHADWKVIRPGAVSVVTGTVY